MGWIRHILGEHIELREITNRQLEFGPDDVRGVNNSKELIKTKADINGRDLTKFQSVFPGEFVFNHRTSRNGGKFSIAYNNGKRAVICTEDYVVFRIKESSREIILAEWLYMYFKRPEFDRYVITNSWGSSTEFFNWNDLCAVELHLPSLPVQQKYVSIYKTMVANQQSYERGLEDLKLVMDAELDRVKHEYNLKPVGEFLQEIDVRNEQGEVKDVQGINITKQFMPSVADTNGVNLRNYKIVKRGQLAYSGMQTGRDECIRIALFEKETPIIISPAYFVFEVKDNSVLAEYIMIWFSREESDRRGWFMSDASIRTNLDLERFNEIKIPVPPITLQKALVELYSVYSVRRDIVDQLNAKVKDVCSILIKGSLEDARRQRDMQ